MKKVSIISLVLAVATMGMALLHVSPALAVGSQPAPSVAPNQATAQAQVTQLGCVPNSQPPAEQIQATFQATYTTYRTLTVYLDGQEYYSDVTQVHANTLDTSTLLLHNGNWDVVVRLGDDKHVGQELAREHIVVNC